MTVEDYIHRIGRTGRAGRKGLAFSLVSEKDVEALKRLESFLKTKLEIGWLEDQDIIEEFKPFPYGFDPHSKMKDLSGKRRDFKSGDRSQGRKAKSGSYSDRKNDRKNPKGKNNSKDFKKSFDKKDESYNGKKKEFKANKAKPKTSGSVKNSKRYKDFKTVSKGSGSQKGGLMSKIFGIFSK
jgi:ATP-dependent RNA helicase RhlB